MNDVESTNDIIKSTVPVLETNGRAITETFYKLLFANYPELLNIFNHANQRQGKQQAALANAVYAAAAHIDRLHAIMPTVEQIAHKHRALPTPCPRARGRGVGLFFANRENSA
ncbi:Flavohemoprotein [Paenibacillus sp. CECT 9249]|nr:hypothetical protein [Paenibacillus sp. MSJ-34]CAH0120131.1 Flavohemoprotein [Paenibacillus sp. CECT 9249]